MLFCVYIALSGSPIRLGGSVLLRFLFCCVLLFLHCKWVASALVRSVRVLLSFAEFCCFCTANWSLLRSWGFAEFCWVLLSFAVFALQIGRFCAREVGPSFAEFCWVLLFLKFRSENQIWKSDLKFRSEIQQQGPGAAAAQGAEPVVPTEAPQQGPRRTQSHKGRNRWFQQRPRNKDQGASGLCENLTKASGTDEIAKKSPPFHCSCPHEQWRGGSGQGVRSNFGPSKVQIFSFSKFSISYALCWGYTMWTLRVGDK